MERPSLVSLPLYALNFSKQQFQMRSSHESLIAKHPACIQKVTQWANSLKWYRTEIYGTAE
jgi:hypothetical protein